MFSEPVVGEKFFGRHEVLELLNKRVSALRDGYRQNIALTGQSLAGKSSIILHFLHTIKEDRLIPIYVEVVKENFRSFANKFIATMLYNSLRKMGEAADIDMERLLDKAEKALPKTCLAIKNINSCIDRTDFDEAYSNLLGLTSILKAETNLSCIVILDEFDNLEKIGVKNPFLGFGKVIMVQKDTMYIVSSSRDAAIKKILSEKLSLLFGNFEVVKIANFDLATSKEFLGIRLADFDMEEQLIKFLIAFTDGNPFYLDRISSRVRAIAIERMSSYIGTEPIAKAVTDLVYNSGGAIHQYLVNFILELLDTKYKDQYLSIMVAIANGRNKQSEIARALKTKHGDLAKALVRLVENGLISKNGVFYKIDDAMLGFWLKHVYQMRKNLLVDGAFNKSALFEDDMRSYIALFAAELDKGTAARIAELFNHFSNELVQIESKHIRLPHFTKVEPRTFQDGRQFIAASFRNNFWIAAPYDALVGENDIINYIRNAKALGCKISNKVIIPLKGMDENAKLLAKELKISIWDASVANMLMEFYDKFRIVML